MSRIYNILILILLYLLFGSRTCTEESDIREANEQRLLLASKDSIKKTFEIYRLSDYQLRAYEETAKHKLIDFADYLKIISDTTLDMRFRQQAAEMLKRLFIPGDIDTRNWRTASADTESSSLDQILGKSLTLGMAAWIKPERITTLKPLTSVNDSTYTGRLSFYQKCIPYDINETPRILSQETDIEILAIRKLKSFGSESLIIWEVFLGNIN